MKKVIITGNVGRDPETRHAASGDSFVTFSFAVTTGSKDNQKTDWLEISCNGRTAETVQKWVRKGSKLLIEGTPSANAYINKEGKAVASLRVIANHIEFIGSRERSEEAVSGDDSGVDNNSFEYGANLASSQGHSGSSSSDNEPQTTSFNFPKSTLQESDFVF